jgi:hypothetical protein
MIRGEEGFALFTVTAFVLVQIISGLAYFALVSYETKGALRRQDSSEAFYLADGAIERARAKFLSDIAWRTGWNGVKAGRGTYDLAVKDTLFEGESVVKLVSTGRVGLASRRIEVIADVSPSAEYLTMLIGGKGTATGNLCVNGAIHINGTDNLSAHLECGPRLTSGFKITPPPIYTDPGHFPDATYYYVMGCKVGLAYKAKVYDRYMNDITASTTDLAGKVSYAASSKTYTFSFTANGDVNKYFNETTGFFKRTGSDVAVVVNFGEPITNPPETKSAVVFSDPSATTLATTIINARFTGVTVADRANPNFWTGAALQVKQITFAPKTGIAAICYDLTRQGSSRVSIGTSSWPALLCVMRDVSGINSNFELTGAAIILRNWTSTGGPALTYNRGFVARLPAYLRDGVGSGVSGTLRVARWREVPA